MAADQTLPTTIPTSPVAPAPPVSLRESLAGLIRPRCPKCRKRSLVCRYVAPDDYTEPAPRFFECSCCAARFFRTFLGRWQDASAPEFDACYGGSGSSET
jgi:hypothetical protein